jgi:protein arginine N-methyltransferase 1
MDVHTIFLRDVGGQRRFRRAITEVVRAGDVVLDIGTGTGIHAVLACHAGASRVYAVDQDDVVHVAREIARQNGYSDRVVCLQGTLPRVDLPEQVDVAVTNQGFSDTLQLITTVREHFLKSGGRLIPSAVQLFAAPLEAARAYAASVRFWSQSHYGVDFSAAWSYATNNLQDVTFPASGFLAPPAALSAIDLTRPLPTTFTWFAEFRLSRSGVIHGIGTWFEYRLSAGVTLSTRPPMTVASPPWQNVLFPFADARRMRRGDRVHLELKLTVQPVRNIWTWNVSGSRPSRGRTVSLFTETHSTFAALPFSPQLLRKLAPEHAPTLHRWGDARRTLLDLCNGRRSIRELEREIQTRYPELFPSGPQAQGFVAEVVARDAQ